MNAWMSVLSLLVVLGCSSKLDADIRDPKHKDGDADADTDADTDTDTDADTDVSVEDPATGQTFCAGGGIVRGDGITGVVCTSPLELTTTPAKNDNFTWQPGPTSAIAPRGGL